MDQGELCCPVDILLQLKNTAVDNPQFVLRVHVYFNLRVNVLFRCIPCKYPVHFRLPFPATQRKETSFRPRYDT